MAPGRATPARPALQPRNRPRTRRGGRSETVCCWPRIEATLFSDTQRAAGPPTRAARGAGRRPCPTRRGCGKPGARCGPHGREKRRASEPLSQDGSTSRASQLVSCPQRAQRPPRRRTRCAEGASRRVTRRVSPTRPACAQRAIQRPASEGVLVVIASTACTASCSSIQMALYTMRCRSTALLPSNAAETTSMLRRGARQAARKLRHVPCSSGSRTRGRHRHGRSRAGGAARASGAETLSCVCAHARATRLTWRPSPCMSVTFTSSVSSAAAICARSA